MRRVSYVGHPTYKRKTKKMGPMAKGALCTAALLGTSSAISWVKHPNQMKDVVVKAGGKTQYALKYAGLFSSIVMLGALTNKVLDSVIQAIKPQEPPRPY